MKRHPIHILWCHPRSTSTAVERVMRERGDLAVLHEPFMYLYYLTKRAEPFPNFEPDPDHPTTYEGIRDMILKRAADGPVFIKDMAYYILPELTEDQAFARAITHAFLVRHPAKSILSYARLDPDFTLEEVGIEGQFRLWEALGDLGVGSVVLESDRLRQAPEAIIRSYWSKGGLSDMPDAFRWGGDVPSGWEQVKSWHGDVLKSGAIKPPNPDRDAEAELRDLPARFMDMYRHQLPFYEALAGKAL